MDVRGNRMSRWAVKWAERWMARAQRKAALRDERFRRHQDGVRAGTESPGFLDRLESSVVLDPANPRHFPRYVNADWPLDARPDEASLRLADAWLTWVGHGPVAGPDGDEVRIWIRSAGHDLPFRYTTGDQGWVRRRDLAATGMTTPSASAAFRPAAPGPSARSRSRRAPAGMRSGSPRKCGK